MLTGRTRVAGVMGWPVAHSLSPRLHGYWLRELSIDGIYVPLPVRPDHAVTALRSVGAMGFAGVNVTVPHKEAALAAVDTATETAVRIGAVNTIVVDETGCALGDNTDAFGFLENLSLTQPEWQGKSGPALVLGAGGSGRAVCAALQDTGVPEIRVANRTPERTRALATSLGAGLSCVAWEDRAEALADVSLVVNTTTLGLQGQPPLDLDLHRLPGDAVVADLVYRPLTTPLLAAALARGNPIVDGLGMLLHQARPGFAAWFGVEPQVTSDLRSFVLAGLGAS